MLCRAASSLFTKCKAGKSALYFICLSFREVKAKGRAGDAVEMGQGFPLGGKSPGKKEANGHRDVA